MDNTVVIATAGNVLAPALSVLRSKGYLVESIPNSNEETAELLQATKQGVCLVAEDALLLLGLAALVEARGENWCPNDGEIEALLQLLCLPE